jgi:hypothetical protein
MNSLVILVMNTQVIIGCHRKVSFTNASFGMGGFLLMPSAGHMAWSSLSFLHRAHQLVLKFILSNSSSMFDCVTFWYASFVCWHRFLYTSSGFVTALSLHLPSPTSQQAFFILPGVRSPFVGIEFLFISPHSIIAFTLFVVLSIGQQNFLFLPGGLHPLCIAVEFPQTSPTFINAFSLHHCGTSPTLQQSTQWFASTIFRQWHRGLLYSLPPVFQKSFSLCIASHHHTNTSVYQVVFLLFHQMLV